VHRDEEEKGDNMICPQCYGRGVMENCIQYQPCPLCSGFGVVLCCEGMQSQPNYTELEVTMSVSRSRHRRQQQRLKKQRAKEEEDLQLIGGVIQSHASVKLQPRRERRPRKQLKAG